MKNNNIDNPLTPLSGGISKKPLIRGLGVLILLFGSIGFLVAQDENQILENTQIIASTLSGSTPLIVELDSNTNNPNTSYIWSFSNRDNIYSKTTTQIFSLPGEYIVSLESTSENGTTTTSQIKVIANDEPNCSPDYDDDGLNNCDDLCPLIPGDQENTGCPILSEDAPEKIEESCLYKEENNYIFGNVICNSCPCKHSLEYNATIRDCDILFPAITSENKRNIYEKGEFFEVR